MNKSICAQCTKPFNSRRYWQRFCSKKCRDNWHYEELKKLRKELQKRKDKK